MAVKYKCSFCGNPLKPRELKDNGEPLLDKVMIGSKPFNFCYNCGLKFDHPDIFGKSASLGKALLRECDRCHQHLPAKQVVKHLTEHLHLCPTCTAKVDATNAKSIRPASELLGNTVHERTSKIDGDVQRRLAELREKEIELRKKWNELLRDSGQPLTLGDELKAQAHDRACAVAKALGANAGHANIDSLQDSQRRNKRAEAIQRQSRMPRPVPYGSLGALQSGQRNSRKGDGLSGSAPGDASAGAEQVTATDRSMPQSYGGYEPSRRDDYFSDILPGSAASSDPSRDYYPDSTNLHPDWVPDGDARPMSIADAGNIRLFTGESSAYFKPAAPVDRFVGSNLVVRSPGRPRATDMGKLALDLAMKLRRGPRVFGKNLF
jgi:hypothetical protein